MNTRYLYYVSVAICGSILAGIGLSSVVSGDVDLIPVVQSIGGIGMVLGVVYEVGISSTPAERVPDDRVVWFTAAMTCIGVVAVLWSLLG